MNLYLLFKFIINLLIIPITLYLSYTGLMNYKKSRTKYTLYFVLTFAIIAMSTIFYSIVPLLIEGQDILAEITLGASFTLLMLVPPIFIEYFHGIYHKVSYLSKIFYYSVGGGFVTLFFEPWEIRYTNDFYGYNQIVSDLLLFFLFIQLICIFIIMLQAFRVIKVIVDDESAKVDRIMKENSDNQDLILLMGNRLDNLNGKKRVFNYIILSYLLGGCLGVIGLVNPGSELDTIGVLVITVVQAYFFSRDKEILVYLSTQKILDDTKDLRQKILMLHQQSSSIPQFISVEIQSMVDFIEKADLLLRSRSK